VNEVEASVEIRASLAETWDYHFDQRFWRTWVDGFAAVVESEGYPARGGTLRWRSTAAGRGEVSEKVLEHEPRRLHRISFTDPHSAGDLTTTFQIRGEATVVEQRLTYGLRGGGIFGWASDKLFIRSQQRGSMRRSLAGLRREVEAAARSAASPQQPDRDPV
jgi:hypothetical protein